MSHSAVARLTPCVVAACTAAAVLNPVVAALPGAPTATHIATHIAAFELTSVSQPLDLLDGALGAAQLPDIDAIELLDIPNAAGYTATMLVNLAWSLVSWIPIVSEVLWPVYSAVWDVAWVLPFAAVDVGDFAGPFPLPALPDLTLPDLALPDSLFDVDALGALPGLDAVGDIAQDIGAALANLLP